MEMRCLDSPIPPWLCNWRGDGILARTSGQKMVDVITATGVPAIELRALRSRHHMPFVGPDNHAAGRLVAEHLLERGFRNFGCYESSVESYFKDRRDGFMKTLADHGFRCQLYRWEERSEKLSRWERQQKELIDWIKQLPKPVGIMACTDQLGFWLLDACNRAGIAVPEEVAVVGVEDDESLCEMATPPMTSVQLSAVRTGYEAAALLDRLMAGETLPAEPVLVSPIGVVARGSSDVVAIDDPLLAKALRFVRERARDGIKVDDVSAAVGMSRKTLERRMRRFLGRSPQEEITRVKLNLVKELLAETTLSLEKIAHRAGFAHVQYLVELFRSHFGTTPGQYRKKVRLPEG